MLRNFDLKIGYNSEEDNIYKDFFAPALSNSIEYKRAVGYFSPAAILNATSALSQFIENITYSDNNRNKVLINYVFDRINNIDIKKKNIPVPSSQYVDIFKMDEKITARNYNIEHLLNQKYRDEDDPNYDSTVIDQIGNLLVISKHTNSSLPHTFKEKINLFRPLFLHVLKNLMALFVLFSKYFSGC